MIWDENIDGPFSNSTDSPTVVTLNNGNDFVIGFVAGNSDYFTFLVKNNQILDKIFLRGYSSSDNVAWLGIQSGSAWTVGDNPGLMLAQQHFGSGNINQEVLSVAAPYNPGNYTLRVQQLGSDANYVLEFQVLDTDIPSIEADVINITKNTQGFKIRIKPIQSKENREGYNIYLSDYTYNLEPNNNPSNFLIKELPFSETDQYFYYIPKNTGLHYLTVFAKNNLGLESSGVLFTGLIPYQNLIKEVSLQNLNYYSSGSMKSCNNSSVVTINEPYALLGYQINYSSPTTPEYANVEGFLYKDFSPYFKNKYTRIYNRVIPALENNSGILFDQTILRNTSNDVYAFQSAGNSINKDFSVNESISISDTNIIRSPEYTSIPSDNNRYFIFDYSSNYSSFLTSNTKYIKGSSEENTILFNPEMDTPESFLHKRLNLTGTTGERPTDYIRVSEPGHYNSYYITAEAIDEDGFSSAGGNINRANDIERYTNQDGYKIVKIQHNSISRNNVTKMFKNYKRLEDNKIIFEIKGDMLPVDIGLESIVIIPQKYEQNINIKQTKSYSDDFIFLKNLDKIENNTEKNYSVELIDSQTETKYRITTYLNPDSVLLKDNIFSAKIYYLNAIQSYSLYAYLSEIGFTNEGLEYYIQNTELIDKYITLNKFIKDTKNYTSTIAASYQGIVYFFTPESFPYIAWPNQNYRDSYLKKGGARMLDFEYDGIASGPEFYDYFPLANAQDNNNFLIGDKYKTTYRCLDSYKYISNATYEFLAPEDVPTTGIYGSESYLGVYDPGNIGDLESPNTADFKSVNYDLNYFKAKNILAVKFISAGIQKDDAYAIVEFILDIPDAEDFIVQGISGTDTILEKGIKEVNGTNYHYFVAKFISSCGVDTDPVLDGISIDQKNIVDSKKMISFLVYPTKFKVIEDPDDVPFFGDIYLLATSLNNNQFSILKECPYTLLNNNTDCIKGCCVQDFDPIVLRAPYKQFYILSQFIGDQKGNNYPFGKIDGTINRVFGSAAWRYRVFDYSESIHQIKYKKPTISNNTLNFGIVCYPEHNVGLDKILIYMKNIDNINNITWKGSDLIDSYIFDDIVKTYPIYLSVPDFSFSKKGTQLFDKIAKDYDSWIKNGNMFAVKIHLVDKSGDILSQTFVFINDQNI